MSLYQIISFAIPVVLVILIIIEWRIYLMFTKNGIEMRKQLSNDPKRFHISIVYIMTYITRITGGDNKSKLDIILQYIVEVIPQKFQFDAVKTLDYLTKKVINPTSIIGIKKSKVKVSLFSEGNYQNCIQKDDTYEYANDLDTRQLVEELSLYLSEKDRYYLMFLLYRIAYNEGPILEVRQKTKFTDFCIKDLKIDENEFYDLTNNYSSENEQIWYDKHFGNDHRYPAPNIFANIYRGGINEPESLKDKLFKTSVFSYIKYALLITALMGFALNVKYANENIFLFFCLVNIFLALIPFYWVDLRSERLCMLRTKDEDYIQNKNLIISSLFSGIILILYTFSFYLVR